MTRRLVKHWQALSSCTTSFIFLNYYSVLIYRCATAPLNAILLYHFFIYGRWKGLTSNFSMFFVPNFRLWALKLRVKLLFTSIIATKRALCKQESYKMVTLTKITAHKRKNGTNCAQKHTLLLTGNKVLK